MSTKEVDTLGEYLKRIRESRNISLRQAAREAGISSAYLSQIESGKRGKRKTGEEHYGPHPQMLKRLAEVYHIPSNDLMARAGYVEDWRVEHGFSETNEIERIFEFVVRDPLLRQGLNVLDKRAIINRYESITGKRLITWAGEPNDPSATKAEFAGIKTFAGCLYADTPHTTLTIDEVAREIEQTPEQVKELIENDWLKTVKVTGDEVLIEKEEVRQFKHRTMIEGMYFMVLIPKSNRPSSRKDYAEAMSVIEKFRDTVAPAVLRQKAIEVCKKHGVKLPSKK